MRRSLLFASLSLFAMSAAAFSQEVVSARSGVVHFLEGAVSLDGQPLDRKAGTFPSVKEGSTLRTEKGRVELLLTPNVFLRMDENSAVRMISSALTDTRLEVLQGSVILDSVDAPADTAVTLIYKQCQVRFPKHGVFRLDSDTDVLRAYSGEAEVSASSGKPVTIDSDHLYFLTVGMETEKFMDRSDDEFFDWAKDRHDAISSENELAQNALDSSQGDPDPNGPTLPLPLYGNSPSYGNSPLYGTSPSVGATYPSSGVVDPSFWISSNPIDPLLGLNTFPYFPTFVFVPYRGYWVNHWPPVKNTNQWPIKNTNHWPGLNTTRSGLGAGPTSTRPGTLRMPTFQPAPITPTRITPTTVRPTGHIYARPTPMPHVGGAPTGIHAGVHAAGHR